MTTQLTFENLLVQWYEEAQNQRISKGFIKVKNINEIYLDSRNVYDNCTRNISLKQYNFFAAIFAKQTKNFPSEKEKVFININNRTLIVDVSSCYNRGFLSFKLK
jgi:hypothetical protein